MNRVIREDFLKEIRKKEEEIFDNLKAEQGKEFSQ
jgi:hypothetical protein